MSETKKTKGPGAEWRVRFIRPTALAAVTVLASALTAPATIAAQTVTKLIGFSGHGPIGKPIMTPAQGRNGQMYGAAFGSETADGSVFGLTTSGAARVLYTFGTATGSGPLSGLTLATDGNFYGTTGAGGSANLGVLFRISPDGTLTVLHEFTGSDGAGPLANPIEGSDGNLYGTTSGDVNIFPSTVYKYTPSGQFSTIFTFDFAQASDVAGPVTEGTDGNLYGTAAFGGTTDNGSIFKISKTGKLLNTYDFPGGSGGQAPYGNLTQTSDGSFYGTTYTGGNTVKLYGTVFKMDKTGAVSIIYYFQGGFDGASPIGGLTLGTDGFLYGTTSSGGTANGYGTLFRISTSGQYEQLYTFSPDVGDAPVAPPLQHTNGLFYGATEYGGGYGYGAIYRLDMGLGEFITFVRASGKAGYTAQILGQGFTGATSVTFNGIPAASFTVDSDTYMTAVVPQGATTGPVEVTTSAGTLKSNVNFRILR